MKGLSVMALHTWKCQKFSQALLLWQKVSDIYSVLTFIFVLKMKNFDIFFLVYLFVNTVKTYGIKCQWEKWYFKGVKSHWN